jgi:CubicO group peptidase (beta-lactamase class C family)
MIVGIGCAGGSSEAQVSLEEFSKHLDTRIPRLMDRYDIPGVSMALLARGRLVWSGAYGYADLGRERRMTVDSVCRAESISKSVTAKPCRTAAKRCGTADRGTGG